MARRRHTREAKGRDTLITDEEREAGRGCVTHSAADFEHVSIPRASRDEEGESARCLGY